MDSYTRNEKIISIASYTEKELMSSLPEKGIQAPETGFYGWPDGMLILGLCEAGYLDSVREYIKMWTEAGQPLSVIDNTLGHYTTMKMYEMTGNEKYLRIGQKVADFVLNKLPRDEKNSLLYSDGSYNKAIYSDGIGMATAFLSEYAKVTHDERAKELARTQLLNFFEYGLDSETGLVYHGYEFCTSSHFPNLGWGRGTGWISLGLGSYLTAFEDREVAEKGEKLMLSCLKYLKDDGMFSWNIPTKDGKSDTTATSMIFWCIAKMKKKGYLREVDMSVLEKTADECLAYVNEYGEVSGASGSCLDFGNYSQEFGHSKCGQGGVLAYEALFSTFR